MQSSIMLACLLIIPDIFSRALIFSKQIRSNNLKALRYKLAMSHCAGIFQDLFVLFELLFILELIQYTHPGCLWLASALLAFIKLDVLLDGYIYKSTELRLEVPFLAFIRNLRCFWDSAKAKKISAFYPLGAVFFLIMIITYEKLLLEVNIHKAYPHISIYLALGCPFVIAMSCLMPRKLSYGADNIIFFQQLWWVKKLYSLVRKKQGLLRIGALKAKKIFKTESEQYVNISTSFPLLKFTHGFVGKKAFDLKVDPKERPHVIFLFMESLRAKDVGILGGKYPVTPNLDRLSQEGILFKNFYANSVKTSRAVTASLFGIPSDVNASEVSSRLNMPFISIAQVLAKYGYHNAYLHNGMLEFENKLEFFPKYGFQTLVGRQDILKKYPHAPITSWGVHDEYLMHYTIDWMKSQAAKQNPLFLTMFTISTHHPWILPPNFKPTCLPAHLDERYRHYLQTTQYSDAALGLFIDLLKSSGLSKNTILFILGDHGHPMGEHHDNFIEQRYLYEENLKVPLLIYADGRIKAPVVVDDVTSQLDLFATVMDMLQLKGLNHAKGESLLRVTTSRQVFFHNPYVYQFYGTRKGSYKLIYMRSTKEVELYDLAIDPEEQHNIAHECPHIVEKYLEDVKNYHEFYKSLYENKLFSPFEKKKKESLVDLSQNSEGTPSQLLSELRKYPFVLHLDLSSCDLLNDDTLYEMIKKHKELRSLSVAHCHLLTEESLMIISECCPQLEWIDVTGIQLTEKALVSFEKRLLYLEKIVQKDRISLFLV